MLVARPPISTVASGSAPATLRNAGRNAAEATRVLVERTSRTRRELLRRHEIDFDQLPVWQRHGVGLFWQCYEKRGYDPVAKHEITAARRRIGIELSLPAGEDYVALLRGAMAAAERAEGD
jgi:tRNA(His) 5'-end guanylyltransferase